MKSIVKATLVASIVLMASGCAGNHGKDKLAKTEDGDVVCRYERTTGSNIGSKVCRTKAQMEYEREQAQRALKDKTSGGVMNGN